MTEKQQPEQGNKGKWMLLIMVLLFGAPYLGTMVLLKYPGKFDLKTKNYGLLLEPVSLNGLEFRDLNGNLIATQTLNNHWQIVQFTRTECDTGCRNNLYKMQQIRKALGVPRHKLERNVLLLDTNNPDQLSEVLSEFDGTRVMTVDGTGFEKIRSGLGDQIDDLANQMFIIDPAGNMVMLYRADAEPKGILGDLKILLKSDQQEGAKE